MSHTAVTDLATKPAPEGQRLTALMGEIAQQDKIAFREFYHLTAAKILGIIFCIVREKALAEDILQETYLKIWQRASESDEAQIAPMSWVTTMARNRALDEVRKRGHLISMPDVPDFDDIPAEMVQPLAGRMAEEDSRMLLLCFDRLDDARKEMILMAYIYGLARERLAQHFNMPVNVMKTWLRRSLTDLRACLASGDV